MFELDTKYDNCIDPDDFLDLKYQPYIESRNFKPFSRRIDFYNFSSGHRFRSSTKC